jgi:L-alanine-DL-glutamate epimerase-like enolase superfamily enzyme
MPGALSMIEGSATRKVAMKITRLDTYFLSIPLPQPVRTSTSTISQVSEVIVKLSTDAGLVGVGEAHGPFLFRQGPEGMRVVNEIMQQITPLVVGEDPFNVKVGGLTPEADAERVRFIREVAGDDVALMLDANQGWDLQTAIRAARLCEPYNIFWLEDPMPWYDERHTLQRLKAAINIPIAAGETEYTPFGLRTLLVEGLVDYLIIDSTWAGGLTTWRKAATMAELYHVPMAAHHDPQIHVHALASSPTGFILESFADPNRDPLWFELFRERPEIVDGYMTLPDTPGLGLELRDDTIEKYGVKIG